ncbi:MAG: hypothetical protein PQJ58_15170 [Spirochaetales bacterium]|nr:hypothetical protein [Spirochaetales bacterium]
MKIIVDVEDMRLDHEPLEKGAEVEVPAYIAEVWITTGRAHRVGGAAKKEDSGTGGKGGKAGGKKKAQSTADKTASSEREGASATGGSDQAESSDGSDKGADQEKK